MTPCVPVLPPRRWTVAALAIYLVYGSVAQQAQDRRLDLLAHSLPESHDGATGAHDQDMVTAAKLAKQGSGEDEHPNPLASPTGVH